jgi:hypothetical protein
MPDIEKLTRRPAEYLTDTGIPQLMGGTVWFLLGSGVLIGQRLQAGTGLLVLQWTSVCCAFAVILAARALKRRIVFPRGGYVELRPRPSFRFSFVITLSVAAGISVFAIARPRHLPSMDTHLMAPGFAIAFAAIFIVSGWKLRSRLLILFGVYLLAIAPLLERVPGGSYTGMSWLEVGIGIPLAVAGAIKLKQFLKANPMPAEPAGE